MRYSLGRSRSVMGFGLMWLFWVFAVEGAHAKERPGQVSKRTVLAGYFPAPNGLTSAEINLMVQRSCNL